MLTQHMGNPAKHHTSFSVILHVVWVQGYSPNMTTPTTTIPVLTSCANTIRYTSLHTV